MKRHPDTIDLLLSVLTQATDIRDQELQFYTLPDDEQTPEAWEELRQGLERRALSLFEQYEARLNGTPEGAYLGRIKREYSLAPKNINDFIDEYNLSTRTANILLNLETGGSKKAGISKISNPKDLLKYDVKQLLKVKGFGKESLLELDAAFQQEGWEIKGIEKYREMERKRCEGYK